MNTKVTRFLVGRFVLMVLICIVIFFALMEYVSMKTSIAVNEITNIHISEINEQIKQKFSAISQLRVDQVAAVIKRTTPEKNVKFEEEREDIRLSAEVRGFTWLGLYVKDQKLESIYGEEIEIPLDLLQASLDENDEVITYGYTSAGEKLFVFGKEAEYVMQDGTKSTAMVAAVPMKYLEDVLFQNEKKREVYSHLIDSKGDFIIRTGDAYRDSYFERLDAIVEDLDGKSKEDYIEELREAINAKQDYTTTIFAEGELRHFCCSVLEDNSDWYVVTVIPDWMFSNILNSLDSSRNVMMIVAIAILLVVFMVVFYQYFRFSQNQMKMLNRSKVEAQRANMAKSEFLSSMSHDIRTPMNAIVGMTEIALRNISDDMRVEDCLRKIRLSSKQLLGLINDVLDMSKIESGKLTLSAAPMSLREAMDDIVNIIKPQVKTRNQFFDIYICDVIAEDVYCDNVRLNQVLLNLLSNALKFTEENGKIDVFIWQEPSEVGDDFVRTHFKVTDTGIGMSEEFQKKIFDSFEREDSEQVNQIMGTGLGMAITKSIIDIMGGTIEVKSELGKGSEFHITVDLQKSEVKEKDMCLPDWNILVVDDDERLCQSAVSNLEEMGAHAEWTTDGRKAIEMVKERHENNEDYRIVLIDWKIPNMDGVETIREIHRTVGKEVPVFLISAYDWNDAEEVLNLTDDIEGFIAKPLFKSTLYMNLSRYASGQSGDSSEKTPQESLEESDLKGKHVLLSEDIDLNWEIANEILSEFGLILDRAVNGKECVEMFEKTKIGYYDAILMDIRMPVMNGYDATKVIRALDREDSDLPIIAMTADAFSDDAQRCLECGMNAHISKPIDIKECKRILSDYLSE